MEIQAIVATTVGALLFHFSVFRFKKFRHACFCSLWPNENKYVNVAPTSIPINHRNAIIYNIIILSYHNSRKLSHPPFSSIYACEADLWHVKIKVLRIKLNVWMSNLEENTKKCNLAFIKAKICIYNVKIVDCNNMKVQSGKPQY